MLTESLTKTVRSKKAMKEHYLAQRGHQKAIWLIEWKTKPILPGSEYSGYLVNGKCFWQGVCTCKDFVVVMS